MKYIEDMSPAEAYSWVSLLATGIIFAYFYQKMTYGGYKVVEYSSGTLMEIFVGLIIMTIVIHAIIAGIFAAKRKTNIDELDFEPREKDERDIQIEHKGERYSHWFIYAAVNVIIFQLLFENSFGGGAPGEYTAPFSVLGPSKMFFALMASLFIGDIIKRVTMVMEYRK